MVSKCYFNDVLDQPVATPNMAPAQYYRAVRLKYFSLMTSCDDKYDLTWSSPSLTHTHTIITIIFRYNHTNMIIKQSDKAFKKEILKTL